MRLLTALAALSLLAAWPVSAQDPPAAFIVIPGLDNPQAISGDGSTVVGTVGTGSSRQIARWTAEGDLEILGAGEAAWDVSADGSVIVGRYGAGAFRWTEVTGFETIVPNGVAIGVTPDGAKVIGSFIDATPADVWVWTAQSLVLIPLPRGSPLGDISADGRFVVGGINLTLPDGDQQLRPFRWSAEAGVDEVAENLVYDHAAAYASSADGAIIAGSLTYTPNTGGFFRWTQAGGGVDLGNVPGSASSCAGFGGMSLNGAVIVGSGGGGDCDAVVWDGGQGLRLLKDLIESFGIDLTGQGLTHGIDISADGRTIVGSGTMGTFLFINPGPIDPFPDRDSDGVLDYADNCPDDANLGQEDADVDLIGDPCDPFPFDGDNEQAQCEADLAGSQGDLMQCQSEAAQCSSDLGDAQTALGQCEVDRSNLTSSLLSCQTQLTQAQGDLAAAQAQITQLQNDLAARDMTITQLQAYLAQCQSDLAACENPSTDCSDGIDNDGDGEIDYPADHQCGSPEDPSELAPPLPRVPPESAVGPPWGPACGLGVELALVLPALTAARRRLRAQRAT